MTYKITTEKQFKYLLAREVQRHMSCSIYPVYSGWRGPGIYDLEQVGYCEAGFVWKSVLPNKPSAPVQMSLCI